VPAGDQAQRAASQNQNINAAAAAARANARDTLARTTRTIQEAQRFQDAARAAAASAGRDSLGINPNLPGNVPLPDVANGLHPGGLEVDPGVSAGTAPWTGADLPTGQPAGHQPGDASNVRIRQTAQTALLSWKTFHVGRKTTLTYDQTAGGANAKKWVAFNQITDPTGVPSQILGSIKADGQVYVINRNGIIFGPTSQVRMPTFVASSLPVNDNLIERGLLNNPDAQFLFSGLSLPANSRGQGTPAFTPEGPVASTGRYGDVTVQRGAVLSSPTDAANAGGRIMLIGANVKNSGTISTPDGQTVLAAGLQVGFEGHNTTDASLRGLDVYVGAVAPVGGSVYAGSVIQDGLIQTARGNVTMAGSNLQQNGFINSSTSVSYNGRLDFQARYGSTVNPRYTATTTANGPPFAPVEVGSITFGPGSVTRVVPELESNATVIGTELALRSKISVQGKTIYLQEGSVLQANGGDISLQAGDRFLFQASQNPPIRLLRTGGQVYVDRNALIDASGSVSAVVDLQREILQLELRSAELAPSPLQRGGVLRAVPLTIDLRKSGNYNGFNWIGTPLGDVRGFAGIILRDVAELTSQGGTVSLSAGDSVVMQRGSEVDVSGGFITYQGAKVRTTRLRSAGQLFDIANASPNRVYDGIYEGTTTISSSRWGITRTFAQPLALTGEYFQPDYVQGSAGGSVSINGASVALDGNIVGRTVDGERQLQNPAPLSSLSLSFLNDDSSFPSAPIFSPIPQNVTFGTHAVQGIGAFLVDANGTPTALPTSRRTNVVLSPSLTEKAGGGFGFLSIDNPDGSVRVASGIELTTAPGGGFTFSGSVINLEGSMIAPGGSLRFTAYNLSLSDENRSRLGGATPSITPGRGRFTLGSSAYLSTAGLVIDQTHIGMAVLPIDYIHGGHIEILGYDVNLGRGSVLDVSGGVKVKVGADVLDIDAGLGNIARVATTYGRAGSIEVEAGFDRRYTHLLGGGLAVGPTLKGYSGITGGSLSLTAPAFQIGGRPSTSAGVVNLSPEFFSQGGFSDVHLVAAGIASAVAPLDANGVETYAPGIVIAPGTKIQPVVEGFLAVPHRAGPNRAYELQRFTRPEALRSPMHLEFQAKTVSDPFAAGLVLTRGDVIVGRGSSIVTDIFGSVSFSANTVTLLGDVTAPGGTISVTGGDTIAARFEPQVALPTVYIGPEVDLSTAGKAVVRVGEQNARVGAVSGGGVISISGNIVAERGSVLDVSGTTGTLDLISGYSDLDKGTIGSFGGYIVELAQLDSNGGLISLTSPGSNGGGQIYVDSTLRARAGGPSAIGGTLTVSSSRFLPVGSPFSDEDLNLLVRQTGYTLSGPASSRGIGRPLTAGGQSLPGLGTFSVDRLLDSGIESLMLGGNVRFDGDVTLTMAQSLRVASGGILQTANHTQLTAPFVKLGQNVPTPFLATDPIIPFQQTAANGAISQDLVVPTFGTGRLTVRADLVETGNLVLKEIGSASILAADGDFRGAGNLLMAGDLVIQAGQIYPVTAGRFNLYAYDYTSGGSPGLGSITVLGGSSRPLPLSAGGTLSVYASSIHQTGTLRAPMGTINLGWDGTGTAPSNPVSRTAIATPVTQALSLGQGSVTSVSAIDPRTGRGVQIPYGISFDGLSWIDPAGNDITVTGSPEKTIRLAAQSITTAAGSVIDLRGGGDFFAYRWVEGNGGLEDILGEETSFAVLPGYDFSYAPIAPFNHRPTATNLRGANGSVNSTLQAGDQLTIGGSGGLRAGSYTLLPARYAVLPGAFLLTQLTGDPTGAQARPDGSHLVNGYRSNQFNANRRGITDMHRFEATPNSTVLQRAEYQLLSANTFLREASISRDFTPPILPVDAGRATFASTGNLAIGGDLLGRPGTGGKGSMVDISSPLDILINRDGSGSGSGVLALSSSVLSRIGAQSLLIGGTRSSSAGGTTVSVSTGSIIVDNAGSPLTAADLILAATEGITIATGSRLESQGSGAVDNLLLGSTSVAGSGDGALVRVSGNLSGEVSRFSISNSTVPLLTVGDGAVLSGGAVTLDSTYGTDLSPTAQITGRRTTLSSGEISVVLDNPGALKPTDGIVLAGDALRSLENTAQSIFLRSYNAFNIYGTGTFGGPSLNFLSLQAGSIRGLNTGVGSATFAAANIELGNSAGLSATPLPAGPLGGRLVLDAGQISTGNNGLIIEDFADVDLVADSRFLVTGNGTLTTTGRTNLVTPLITGLGGADSSIRSSGALTVTSGPTTSTGNSGGLGATLSLTGSTVDVDSSISLRSGNLTLQATAGNVTVGTKASARLDTSGSAISFLDVTRYTRGGTVTISAANGSVELGSSATVDVSASGLADAGDLVVNAPTGQFTLTGTVLGSAQSGRRNGSFVLDAARVTGNDLKDMDERLNTGGFNEFRDYRVRTGNLAISGSASASTYRVAVDSGSLTVSGNINASGQTGGVIDLASNGSLTLLNGARLNASAQEFNSAGQGGAVTLAAGTSRDAVVPTTALLDLQSGSTIDLSVAAETSGSARLGQFSGTLHLRAPQTSGFTDVSINQIGSTITKASSVLVEGYRLYDLTASGGSLSETVRDGIRTDAEAFLGQAGSTSAHYTVMLNRLDPSGALNLILAPGAEIVNRSGSLTMGSESSPGSQDWNLSGFRFGPKSAPGVLTMRASENLTFFNALSDGFTPGADNSLWLAPLSAFNPSLPANSQSWSYRLTAGADLSSANFRAVRPQTDLSAAAGFVEIGKNAGDQRALTPGASALSSSIVPRHFQVIRTGSGDIDVAAGRSVRLLNPFAAIYTAGTQVQNATSVVGSDDFVLPNTASSISQGNLGARQQTYSASYSMAGGNVSIFAAENLERKARNTLGELIDDSSRQLPNNWLYRRGYVDGDGAFGQISIGGFTDLAASTSWWVDFSNFFQSSGALGGGNVTLKANGDIRNFDAVIPTNARAPRGLAANSPILELGGGDLTVRAGGNLDAGVYYVERGIGRLQAGREITTNATRSPSAGLVGNRDNPGAFTLDPRTWLPTTLFTGNSSFDVSASGDLLLGPVGNPFLLPQGQNNGFWYKTYFTTLGADSVVRVSSLGGDVTLRSSATPDEQAAPRDILQLWLETQGLMPINSGQASSSVPGRQPWLRLAEGGTDAGSNLTSLAPLLSIRPQTMEVTSLGGNVNVTGSFSLFPALSGQLELIAGGGSVNALQPTGLGTIPSASPLKTRVVVWSSARINVSDSNPQEIANPRAPLSYFNFRGSSRVNDHNGGNAFVPGGLGTFFLPISSRFNDSGAATNSSIQAKATLHAPGVLHRNDSNPLRIFAMDGDISGLQLFSPKFSRLYASNDISDIAFYIQNARESDTTFITAGRDIIPYAAATLLRNASLQPGNQPSPVNEAGLAGDIHIGGPGSLQILAGRDVDLGSGPTNSDGTGSGIVSLGNIRNPALPFDGADLFIGAGLGPATSLSESALNVTEFIATYVRGPKGAALLAELGVTDFNGLSREEQARVALDVFYLILRDTGRAYNELGSPGFGNYTSGFAAIDSLFGDVSSSQGDILTQTRNIRTRTGGDLSLFAPNGGLTLSDTILAGAAVPPGIVTEAGGRISIFANDSVSIGVGRIFTLRGGNMVIWSSTGDIAAGAASKTVASAPPTRVIIDTQTGAVETDLAGLSTGGGIGVLAAVANVKPGDVDLIAPSGIIDAGDAGIRVTGNINLAATAVVNASNISVGGSSTGAPAAPTVAAPNIGGMTGAAGASAANSNAASAATEAANKKAAAPTEATEVPSLISVEVLGYGGGSSADDEEENRRG
jgi:filamentous hemagglutinin family protein